MVTAAPIPWSYTSLGQRSYGTSGPAVWNDMPVSINSSDQSLNNFKIFNGKPFFFRQLQYDVATHDFATA